ncbi:hypothetical protein B0H63DRAFT_115421 [Podospora didyma]|uniref:RanBD1 domain-containing protein n=1 Tax=Podospora didyma TaxID=330526 RepID=A0AAE0U4G2_9PEZI|nr:hypothetical protein B0H63DRAFT_115421 [Podospora didyma]
MADDPHNTSDISDTVETGPVKEDAETTAARRELKQTSLSEKGGDDAPHQSSQDDKSSSSDDDDTTKDKPKVDRTPTPDTEAGDSKSDELKEQVASPKKKRAHHELEEHKDGATNDVSEAASEPNASTAGAPTQSRTDRSEPEKKRPRDGQPVESGSMNDSEDPKKEKPKSALSSSAFASSGFAKLAGSSTSPFGALGASGKPSLFGSSSSGSSSPFSVLGGPKPSSSTPTAPSSPPKLSFGGGAAAASPFAGLNGKGSSGSVFGSGSGFSSVLGGGSSALRGSALGSFGKPATFPKSDKPARPFGAPESDNEDEDDKAEDDDASSKGGDAGSDSEDKKETEGDKEESSKPHTDDKKKPRLQKIVVDDGEGDEVTLLAVRAKMYQMEKGTGWKERGAGMLKINVPRSSVELDENGNLDPSTFDASVLDEDEDSEGNARKHVRLIMRQDHTLRVILNTVIVPAMTFQVTKKLKSANVLFTAFEGTEAIPVQMKLSEANATLFNNLVEMIQRSLADV